MNLQYITDSNGKTTGVIIPIDEWNDLKDRFSDLGREAADITGWHQEIVRKRMELYHRNPEQAIDFDAAMDRIEKDL